jgi:hypothetical protein
MAATFNMAGDCPGAHALAVAIKKESPETIITNTSIGFSSSSMSAAEIHDLAAVGAVAPESSKPEAKRRRATSARPVRAVSARSRSPARIPLDATMVLPSPPPSPTLSAFGSAPMDAPATPLGAGGGTVNRAELNNTITTALGSIYARMEELMAPAKRATEIAEAVQTRLAPVQEDLAALHRRMSKLEERFAWQNYAGDGGEASWDGWQDYGHGAASDGAWESYDTDPTWLFPNPREATWAERAAKVAGGVAKGSGKGKDKGKEKAKAKTLPSATAKPSSNKVRISTFGGERVKIADLKEAVNTYLAGNNQPITFNGSIFGNSYSIVFGGTAEQGAACAQAALKGLKLEGGAGYRKVHCRSAIEGRAPVQLFFNPDKNAAQQASEYHFRVFKRAVKETHDDPNYLVDPRDKMLSLAYRPIVQLLPVRGTADYKVLFHNPAALEIFSPEQQTTVAEKYRTTVAAEALRG